LDVLLVHGRTYRHRAVVDFARRYPVALAGMDNDDNEPKPPAPVDARPRVIYKFSCGAGRPCTVETIIDSTSRRLDLPALPPPPEEDPAGK